MATATVKEQEMFTEFKKSETMVMKKLQATELT